MRGKKPEVKILTTHTTRVCVWRELKRLLWMHFSLNIVWVCIRMKVYEFVYMCVCVCMLCRQQVNTFERIHSLLILFYAMLCTSSFCSKSFTSYLSCCCCSCIREILTLLLFRFMSFFFLILFNVYCRFSLDFSLLLDLWQPKDAGPSDCKHIYVRDFRQFVLNSIKYEISSSK